MRYLRSEIEAIRELEGITKKQGERIRELEAEVERLNHENFWLSDDLAAEVEDLESSFDWGRYAEAARTTGISNYQAREFLRAAGLLIETRSEPPARGEQ